VLSELPATDKGLEIRYSCPRVHIRAWRQAYGEEQMMGLLNSLNDAPPVYIRVNTTRTTADKLSAVLADVGVLCEPIVGLPNALRLSSAQALHCLPDEIKSHFYFQDIASQWCCLDG
jgi:16S rRNA (cytosine967-C5)-methyltransferase